LQLASDWWLPQLTWRTAALLPLAWLFGAMSAARRGAFRHGWLKQERMPVPVVIVGNLVLGGSGKTPLVIELVTQLQSRGMRPGVISRGFGRSGQHGLEVGTSSSPADCGDEPLLIRRRVNCPVFVAARRANAARALLAAYPDTDVILADDGLQHLRLARDFEIAVFDTRGAGNGCLLPAGPLREPLARLDSVDARVANGRNPIADSGFAMQLQFGDLYQLAAPAHTCPLAQFAGRHGANVAAVAGIGNPQRFFDMLRSAGLDVAEHPFPDHHPFTRADTACLAGSKIVMTEKDALKCAGFDDPRIWVVPVTAKVDRGLIEAILEKLRGRKAA